MTLNNEHVLHTELGSGVIFTKFDFRQLIRAWIMAFLMLIRCHAVILTFDLLTLNFYSTSGIMRVNAVQNVSKSNNPRLSYWRFSTFSQLTELSRGAWTQLHQTWPDHRAIIAAFHLCFRFQISCCIFKRGRLKVEWCFKRRQNFTFWPLWKLGKGKISVPIIEALPTTEPPKYIWWPSTYAAADHGGLIKKEKSSCVKLKAFSTNVGRPNERFPNLSQHSSPLIKTVKLSSSVHAVHG